MDPITYALLKKLAAKALPEITPADAGKVLTVNNSGVWVASERQIPITYADLVALRNAGKLATGATYRITDYVTKINGTYDLSALGASGYVHVAKSAEHTFDLIVYAVDESHLSEIARAALHSGDTHFANASIDAWELRYCLDNDATRFSWADTTNGKGVIYWMRDEWDNEAGYDFKNVLTVRYALSVSDPDLDTGLAYDASTQPNRYGSPYQLFTALRSYMDSGTYVNPFPAPYDFAVGANIIGTVQMPTLDETYLSTFAADVYYTFDYYDGTNHSDASLNANAKIPCRNNKIDATSDPLLGVLTGNQTVLGLGCNCWETNAVFVAELSETNTDNISNNEIGNGCFFNTFGNTCCNNELGDYSYANSFGSSCDNNSFGSDCSNNSFGSYCSNNSFGSDSYNNSFGSDCYNNSFGSYCQNNSFGSYCQNNSFGSSCDNNSFGSYCQNNSFGSDSYNNSFGSSCDNNSFGSDCSNNSFGSYCSNNSFGSDCYNNSFGSYCYNNSFGVESSSNALEGYIRNCEFGDFVRFVELTAAQLDDQHYGTSYHIMDNVQGTDDNNKLTVTVNTYAYGATAPETYVGYNSSGVLKTWCPADLAN